MYGYSETSLAPSVVGVTASFSWVLVHTRFCCALQESVSPVPWKFSNQSQIPWELSVFLLDTHVGKSVVGLRTFAAVQELLWYNCSPVRGSLAWQLYIGASGNLFEEDFCCIHTFQVCCNQIPCPCGRPLLTWDSTGDTTQSYVQLSLLLWRGECRAPFPSPGVHKGFFVPSEHLWRVWDLILKYSCAPPTVSLGLFLFLWTQRIYMYRYIFGITQHSPVYDWSAARCNFGVLTGEDECASI